MLAATTSAFAETSYVASGNGLNLREEPSENSEVIEVLPYGEELNTMEYDDEWTRVLSEDGVGYVDSDWISDEDPSEGETYLGSWTITAYAATGSPCASGTWPEVGRTVACNSLPFGTRIRIEGVGERIVEDRGPDYLGGDWCDLYLGDYDSCVGWGNQRRDVYLIE